MRNRWIAFPPTSQAHWGDLLRKKEKNRVRSDGNQKVVEAAMERIPPGGGRPPLGHAAEHLTTRFSPRGNMSRPEYLMAAEESFGKTRGTRITAGTFFGSTSLPNTSADGGDAKRAARRPVSSREPTNSPSSAASCIPAPIPAAEHGAVPGPPNSEV